MFCIGCVLGERVKHVAGGGVAEACVTVVVVLTLGTTVDSATIRGGEKVKKWSGKILYIIRCSIKCFQCVIKS